MIQPEQYKKTVLYLTLIALLFLLVIAFWRELRLAGNRFSADFCYPYLRTARTGFDSLSDQTLLVFSRRELASQLEQLRKENIRLAAQAASAAELLWENERLRKILALSPAPRWKHVHCEVILRDPRFWHERLTVDKGSIHGVETGAAAIAIAGEGVPVLVGVVSEVTRQTAVITTIYNQELRISAFLPKSNTAGIVHTGSMPGAYGMLPVGFLPLQKNYTPGEMLQTSGFERGIPPGIKIGNLGEVQSVDSLFSGELFLSGHFTPAMRLNEVRFLVLAVRKDTDRGNK